MIKINREVWHNNYKVKLLVNFDDGTSIVEVPSYMLGGTFLSLVETKDLRIDLPTEQLSLEQYKDNYNKGLMGDENNNG